MKAANMIELKEKMEIWVIHHLKAVNGICDLEF